MTDSITEAIAERLSLGTIPEGLRNALEQVRAGVEGE